MKKQARNLTNVVSLRPVLLWTLEYLTLMSRLVCNSINLSMKTSTALIFHEQLSWFIKYLLESADEHRKLHMV